MSNYLYTFWGLSAGLSGLLFFKMFRDRKKFAEISEKIAKYGVLGVQDLMELGHKIDEYQLENFCD